MSRMSEQVFYDASKLTEDVQIFSSFVNTNVSL